MEDDTEMTDYIQIFQDGESVGQIPQPDFAPRNIVSFLLDSDNRIGGPLATVRRGDFKVRWIVTDNGWSKRAVLDADTMLGLGDLEDIHGFIRTTVF